MGLATAWEFAPLSWVGTQPRPMRLLILLMGLYLNTTTSGEPN